MDDTLDVGILLEHSLRSSLVAQVYLLESRTDARDFLDAVEDFNLRIRQIVDNNNFVACLLQFYGGVGTNETGSTSNENGLFHFSMLFKLVFHSAKVVKKPETKELFIKDFH